MKVSEVETVLIEEFPNLAYVRIHTDEGLVGLGETFFGARTCINGRPASRQLETGLVA